MQRRVLFDFNSLRTSGVGEGYCQISDERVGWKSGDELIVVYFVLDRISVWAKHFDQLGILD